MARTRRLVESRSRRLWLYVTHNGRRMVIDASLLIVWVSVATALLEWLEQPTWLLYVVLFAGVVLYSRITPTWERPYRSPD